MHIKVRDAHEGPVKFYTREIKDHEHMHTSSCKILERSKEGDATNCTHAHPNMLSKSRGAFYIRLATKLE